jgi:hypothetical protein
VVSVPPTSQRNKWHSATRDSSKGLTNEGTSPDADGTNYARTLKVTKAERFKKGALTHALIFKPSRLQTKGKVMSLAKAFCSNKGNITFNGV